MMFPAASAVLMQRPFMNPYGGAFTPLGGYGNGRPGMGGYGMTGGYGMPGYQGDYGSGGYGGSYGSNSDTTMQAYDYVDYTTGNGYGQATAISGSPSPTTDWRTFVTALGVPTENGRLSWPLGLQILRPESETQELRQQVNALIQVAASAALNGHRDQRTVDDIKEALAKLRSLLRINGKDRYYPSTYRESERFLTQLEKGLKVLE